jgi:hypothetical protein
MNASEITTGSLANARTSASSSNGASTIVARDASGNFTANNITATRLIGGVSLGANTLTTTGWTITQTGNNLTFSFSGTVRFSISSAGDVVAQNNVTAFGTPA